MYNALARGKFKLESDQKEDTLTSSVLDYLLLLPDTMIWEIIRKSNPENSELPPHVGRVLDVHFWPSWDTKDIPDVSNTRYIEPDVFIEFEYADIIIEAKRYDNNQQSEKQWADQIKVYRENISNDSDNKQLIYFALGGIRVEKKSIIEVDFKSYDIFKIRWRQLMEIITSYTITIELSLEIVPTSGSYLRILQTILDALALHGYYISNHIWFETLDSAQNNLTNSLTRISLWIPQTT
ncbi:hypothetical protein F0365_08010 [Nonlabens sp. Ci31]|jgi:hypothetical protein|uniref:hypothetical protein n=1 Tax=Nonlabens sp. Ci31 TaxID=2608253 RepID=UPI0014641CEB|nr:hypothetical protein [Nonlabens sp. Ci31]QJP34345.1 hypothetical protein F0365_08010 [Nonlabens sp. Ci31]